ncbi:MAG TPA: ABC transporter ATP-binding protein [Woeseiaceae bacterium]|nr:ABC transporter ATP-binding protein [Woeseiaceae bacterium]
MEIVRLEHVYKEYPLGTHTVKALTDVSFTVDAGVLLALAGPSGSGKSTLLNLIGLIDTPTSGRVIVAGQDVSGKDPDALADLRARTVGFIFQSFNLFPVLTAEENVEFPLLQIRDIDRNKRKAVVAKLLDIVGLSKYARHRPNQLSGGQRQRVAIARALVHRPKIVLADEPTANLDHKTGEGILSLMKAINRRLGTTFVFSTHDQKVIDFADRYIGVEDGEVRFLGVRKDGEWLIRDEWRQKARIGLAETEVSGVRSRAA